MTVIQSSGNKKGADVRAAAVNALMALLLLIPALLFSEPLVSPSWGFKIDLPEGYEYVQGDGRDRFSFQSALGTSFDIIVYSPGVYAAPRELAEDVQRRLGSWGDISSFGYRGREAALHRLSFRDSAGSREGWALCVELDPGDDETRPILLALAYGPAGKEELQVFHFSALDSISPGPSDRLAPGPVTEFSYPREKRAEKKLSGIETGAFIFEDDAEAAQAVVDREFAVLRGYQDSPLWKEAWTRFYRAIFRDSFERLDSAAFMFERRWNQQNLSADGLPSGGDTEKAFAEAALKWVQGFAYERDFMGSDFVNLVSAAFEGRGDCDSRALLWAVFLEHNNIPAAIMVSRDYGHAMGLTDMAGNGARFDWQGTKWLVAETTAEVPLGLIGASVSDPAKWLGISFQ